MVTPKFKEERFVEGYAISVNKAVKYIMDQIPSNEVIRDALRQEVKMYPLVVIRELVANAVIHQDLDVSGVSPTIEIFKDRIEVRNPGKPLVDIMRFVDASPRSRNEELSDFLRRIDICDERGSGWDKIARSIESFQLPSPRITYEKNSLIISLFAPKSLKKMSQDDKNSSCYLHACLNHVSNKDTTNTTIRKRFKLKEGESAIASKILTDTMSAGLIKKKNPESISRKYSAYIPFWVE